MKEALKLALETLESSRIFVMSREMIKQPEGADWYDSRITAIKESLAQPTPAEYAMGYVEGFNDACKPQPEEPDYMEALRVLSLALEEAPTNLTPKQRSVWQQSKAVLLSGGGLAQPEFLSTNEANIAQLIEERDVREDILDKVLDMVLGIDRPEWSSSYQYIDAVEDVREALAQPAERNFCPRCGKRTADLTTIHTCTPPRENA